MEDIKNWSDTMISAKLRRNSKYSAHLFPYAVLEEKSRRIKEGIWTLKE